MLASASFQVPILDVSSSLRTLLTGIYVSLVYPNWKDLYNERDLFLKLLHVIVFLFIFYNVLISSIFKGFAWSSQIWIKKTDKLKCMVC